MPTMQELIDTLPQRGSVEWIGLRPERRAAVERVSEAEISTDHGLAGDHYGKAGGKRQVTLIQGEHLDAIASILGVDAVDPGALRRNIVVRGINLLSLKDKQFSVGAATLEYTGKCHPCSWMEQALGPGGYNAMRGHGGITARVVAGGTVRIGDSVAQR
ncbi:MAG: MOSC domain-containing protein [Woeseiaceae bacterium]|nr:MOSC domain-containing protein [Woeseiaceae bacterium]